MSPLRLSFSRRLVAIATVVFVACAKGQGVPAQGDGTLVTPYLAIGDTLAQDKLDELPRLAAQVVEAAQGKEAEPGMADIVAGAGRVPAQDIATARTAFKKVSDGLLRYLEAHPEERQGLIVVHCPMTFGGQGGDWVQKDGKVMNPYEGAMMLHCGNKVPWDKLSAPRGGQ